MIRFCFAIVMLILSGTSFAEYREGWTNQNFYEALTFCRSAIIFPAAKEYEEAGLKHGQTRLAMRNESIAMTRVFEDVASDTCYCALNEYAQDYVFSDTKVRKMDFAEYLRTPDCRERMAASMERSKKNGKSMVLPHKK